MVSLESILRAGSLDYEIKDELLQVRIGKIVGVPDSIKRGVPNVEQYEQYQLSAKGHDLDGYVLTVKKGFRDSFGLALDVAQLFEVPVGNVQFGDDVRWEDTKH